MEHRSPFPHLASQETLAREARAQRVRAVVGDVLGGIGLAALLVTGLFAAAGWGAV